ncbi:glycosyltransferase [Brevibacillus panacihumi]|uniref:glycosyltransferase n=1 Tax=Brevibacillus panacihumi TaxID=497735 RepID=UPI003D21A005
MKISACVITKNEENNLSTCLDSLKSVVSEIIVVDTGSTDRTVEIAKNFGAKVFLFEWKNDFAAARNYAIEQAKSDWIIFLDADEYFAPDCIKEVPLAIREAHTRNMDMIISMMSNIEKKTGELTMSNLQIRIFKNDPKIRYVGAIHERLVKHNSQAKTLDAQKKITIIHTGYSEEDLKVKEKGNRNLSILLNELEKRPDSFDLLFYISESYLLDKKFEEAIDYALKAQQNKNSEIAGAYEKNHLNIIQCLIQLSRSKEVILGNILQAIEEYPDYPDFHLYLGDYYKIENRNHDAINTYQTALDLINRTSAVQSAAIATAPKVLGTVGHLYSKLSNWNQCVKYHVQALQVDKYLYSSLVNLMDVLGKFENPKSVYSFLMKIYDETNLKDCLCLLRASLETNNTEIASFLFSKLPVEAQSLKEYSAVYYFLNREYQNAFLSFLELFNETMNERYAFGALASSWMGNCLDQVSQLEVAFADHGDLSKLTKAIIENKFSIGIDKGKMLQFLFYISGTLKVCEYQRLLSLAKGSDLLLEMANCLYYQDKYADAYYFYNEYLEQGMKIPEDMLADITYKVGRCLLESGLDEHAWSFLLKTHSLAPEDFRVYESLIRCANSCSSNNLNDTKRVWETAIRLYPDSHFLQRVMREVIDESMSTQTLHQGR